MDKMTMFIAALLLYTTCDTFVFNIDEKEHKKHVSDRNFFLETQAKDSKFLCSITVINGYQNSDVKVFGIRPQ